MSAAADTAISHGDTAEVHSVAMKPNYGSAFGIGALVGLVLATATMLFVGATGGVPKLTVLDQGSSVEPAFSVPASAMWIVTIVAGAVCGLALAIATKTIARIIDPDTDGASMLIIAPLGAIVGGVVCFAIYPLGITLLGEVADGLATASVADIAILTAVAGLAAGSVITWQSYILARPPVPAEDTELMVVPRGIDA